MAGAIVTSCLALTPFLGLVFQAGEEEHAYLSAALEVARWLSGRAIETENGRTWPVASEGEPRTSPHLYDGAPGVILVFLEAHHLTGRPELLVEARAGADDLVAIVAAEADELPAGLYVGLSGVAFTLCEAWRATGEARYRAAAERCLALLSERARTTDEGVEWSATTDVISGGAGIGLFLLYAGRTLERPDAVLLAQRAGDRLIALGIPADGGRKWAMTPGFERRMPNFSHGTAGVGYFLVALYEATGEERFRESAVEAARYLRAIAAPQEPDGALILHSEPGREDLFYLGWCHGPAGTVRFLRTLARVTRDEAWLREGEELVSGLHASGIPGARPAGFWNNVGACCGNAGVVDFLLALHELDGRERDRELAVTLLADLLARSTADENGRRWTHAEHRVRPDELSTQTGFMQGAAGIGMVLLRAWAYETGRTPSIVLPDEPWPGLVRRNGR